MVFSHKPVFKGFLLFFFLLVLGAANGENLTVSLNQVSDIEAPSIFPGAYLTSYIDARNAREAARPYWAATEAEQKSLSARPLESIILNNDILAYYGHPLSRNMGILGRYTKEELNAQLTTLAKEYDAVNGARGVKKAFYIIYGTVWPKGEIGIIKESVLKEYVDYALANDILIFIDHQIGRYDPVESLKRMLPWLRYPNVHLALDPEWRTDIPMKEIGTVSAEEINRAQRVMEDYIIENRIPGERFLVVHQFNWMMISERGNVRADFKRVRLVHCADGHGPPHVKRSTYAYNAQAANIPVKSFKLFYDFQIPGAGVDRPLLKPKEVLELNPRPYIIMYQ
ncbi:MAG: hypothetical protein LBH43_07680 [Treponema sp.]|jgi:hypothetical protein|nr:hypothetical protein [Treponema sp.]